MKTILLCADDFGFTPGISQGILQLARLQRLSAVSCMVNQPSFGCYAKELLALKNQIQIGLHFNLTEGNLLSFPGKFCFSLKGLLLKTHMRLINPVIITNELEAQLDQFKLIMGCLPDFIDGHQHVHQFPGIRKVLLGFYEKYLRQNTTFVRSTYPAISLKPYQLKTKLLAFTGGKALQADLQQGAIPHNNAFSGIYDFAKDSDYRSLFRQWLALVPTNTLIMCHPGEGTSSIDAIAHARPVELHYFLSDEFLSDCREFHVKLATGPKTCKEKAID